MKKFIILLFIVLITVGCSSELKGVEKDAETGMQVFTFTEDEFKKAYEDNTGKVVPVSFELNYSSMGIRNVNAEQVEGFLKTSYDMLGDEIINKMYKSFKEDRTELTPGGNEGWRKVELDDRLLIDYGLLEDDTYMSSISLNFD